jgi:hypothetical protein
MSVLDFLAHESCLCLLILLEHFFLKFIFLFCVALFYFGETKQHFQRLNYNWLLISVCASMHVCLSFWFFMSFC